MRFAIIGGASAISLVLLAFGRSIFQGFAPIDDSFLIVGNLAVRGVSPENLHLIFTTFDPELYIPLTLFSWELDYLLGGGTLNPFPFHLTNLVLHLLNALLVASTLILLTKRRWLSAFAGLLFAVHPQNSEAVVWLAGRKDLLSTLFFLLSFLSYLQYRKGSLRFYGLSIVLFLLALLSKVNVLTLPAILLLVDLLIEKRPRNRSMLLDKIPYILLSLLFASIALFGKERVVSSSSLLETLLMAFKSTAFYLQKFLLPLNLSVFYPYEGEITIVKPDFFVPAFLVLLLLFSVYRTLTTKPWIAFGFLTYVITLSPTFLNFHKGEVAFFAVDRYAYLPSIGLLFLLVEGLGVATSRAPRLSHRASTIAAATLLGVFCLFSAAQTRLWDSPEKLFGHALRLYPHAVNARVDLARTLRDQGKYEEAFALLKEGLRFSDHPHLHLAAGYIYARTGQVEDAHNEFEKARTMNPKNPEATFALGSLAEKTGNRLEAKDRYEEAIALDPSYVVARVKLGNLLEEEGKFDGAFAEFQEAVRWYPSSFEGHLGLASSFQREGNDGRAAFHLERASLLRPEDPAVLELQEKIKHTKP